MHYTQLTDDFECATKYVCINNLPSPICFSVSGTASGKSIATNIYMSNL